MHAACCVYVKETVVPPNAALYIYPYPYPNPNPHTYAHLAAVDAPLSSLCLLVAEHSPT